MRVRAGEDEQKGVAMYDNILPQDKRFDTFAVFESTQLKFNKA